MKVVGWGNAGSRHMLFDSGRGALESSQERFGSSGNGLILPKTKALGATSDIPWSRAAVGHGA
jgi:hypothetical protein